MKILKIMLIIVIIGLIASVVMNVMQAKERDKSDEHNFNEQQIIDAALRDLDIKAAGHITLTNIITETEGDNTYKTFVMYIEDNGIYLVSATYLEGKFHYADVEKKLL